jgi:hypothetical protein
MRLNPEFSFENLADKLGPHQNSNESDSPCESKNIV